MKTMEQMGQEVRDFQKQKTGYALLIVEITDKWVYNVKINKYNSTVRVAQEYLPNYYYSYVKGY